MTRSPVTANPWVALREHTNARIALGRAGVSLPTQPQLAFQLAHAQARDAVHEALDVTTLHASLERFGLPLLSLHSAAIDRDTYLQRPDLGRRLDQRSRQLLEEWSRSSGLNASEDDGSSADRQHDLALVMADGLSARAVATHAPGVLSGLVEPLRADGWQLAPLTVVEQGRVAVADDIGVLLSARLTVIFIGERPGLSSPDSMGLYLTWWPRPGLTDAQRNCISNVRPAGLGYEAAARQLHQLLNAARRRELSGVRLKAETPPSALR